MSRRMISGLLVLVMVLLVFSSQAFASSGLLKIGSRGNAVVELQNKLNALGYNAGKADGIFGSKTRSAVMAFQRANGLTVDGIVGPATWAKLNSSSTTEKSTGSKAPAPKTETSSRGNSPITQTLRLGSRGSQVKILQERLNSLGYNAGKADGIFGSKTRSAVMAFQRANGLAVDGIVGPATIAKLYPSTSQPKTGDSKPKDSEPSDPKPSNPPATSKPPITQTLRQGSRGNQVKILQERLNSLGYNAGKADGIFGSKTKAAVMAFQRANGLVVDGIVGPATIAKLYPPTTQEKTDDSKSKDSKPSDPKPSNPPATSKPPITQTLREGSRGNQVKILQERLNSLGYNAGKADGIFGSKTKAAVMAFQRANGLVVDGIVGPATIAKLYPQQSQPKPEKPKEEKPKEEEPKTGFKEFKPNPGELAGKIIIIDAGHGDSDPGAVWEDKNGIISKKGTKYIEKDFNLDMALRLERMLKQAGATVLMTRTTDTYYSLFYRSAFVNNYIVEQELKYQQGQKKVLADQKQAENEKLEAKKDDLAKAEKQLTVHQNDLKTKKQELEDLRKKHDIEKLKAELPNMQNEYNDKLVLYDDLESDISEAEALEEAISALNVKIADLRTQLEGMEPEAPEYEELENELIAAEDELEAKENELRGILEKYGVEKTEDLEDVKENLKKEIDELKTNISIVENFDALTKEIEKLQNETIPQAEGEVERIKGEISTIEGEIRTLNSKISSVDALISDLNRKADLLRYYLNNRNLNSRTGIYTCSSTAGGNVVSEDLKEIFDLTRAKYEDNIIFISIHCNASGSSGSTTTASGVQVYYRDNSSSPSDSINKNYYKSYNEEKRIKLAKALLKHTSANTNFKGTWSQPRIGDFHVIREHNLPSVLMEIGFVNNPQDAKLLSQPQTREDAAKGMYLGIVEYFKN